MSGSERTKFFISICDVPKLALSQVHEQQIVTAEICYSVVLLLFITTEFKQCFEPTYIDVSFQVYYVHNIVSTEYDIGTSKRQSPIC